jgi:hypothetical protein
MRPAHCVLRIGSLLLVGFFSGACGGDSAEQNRTERVPNFRGPELVPKELVAALLTGFVAPGAKVPEIVVRRLPESVPFDVPRPENARIVGGLARPSNGTLVFSVAQRPRDAVRAYEELLRRSGWEEPTHGGGGFRPPDVIRSGVFCQGEKRSISTTAAERGDGETYLQVRYSEADRYSQCEEPRRESFAVQRGPMPTLDPPQRTAIVDANVGGNRNYMEASARLKTDLRPAQLVAHYGEQLKAEGWAQRSETSGEGVSAQAWRIEDRRGKVWIGVLVAIAIPDSDDREVLFRVMPLASSS